MLHTIGKNNVDRLSKAWFYCCESRNPFLQIFFVLLSSASILCFLKFAMPHFPGPYLHWIHNAIIPIQIIWLYVSYYIVCTANPGIITPKNIKAHLDYYKYDRLIYAPKDCSTCKLQKPARSKHCSMCKACIGRLDHHCAWINGCVGENNQRYFFIFLMTLVQFCAYGAYLCFQIYRGMIIEWGLDKAYVYDPLTHLKTPYVLQHDRIIGAIGILAAVVSVVVFIFLAYQIYLAGRGITTNEAFKWEMIEDAIDRGELFKIENIQSSANGKNYTMHTSIQGVRTRERKIESLTEIDNIYDKGFMNNLYEVFFPPRF
ncbi:hypothetical protein CU097_005392 [Rhizopus azygosporus]|uniref:Palmitoyltransferase n=1 Tax=Rhizopus azygosporus TaxID=86630 RepID=A0A367J536_RHIAZ|nr:hypothetical protein CU097_005392 [Rhizopus azygosporus]